MSPYPDGLIICKILIMVRTKTESSCIFVVTQIDNLMYWTYLE